MQYCWRLAIKLCRNQIAHHYSLQQSLYMHPKAVHLNPTTIVAKRSILYVHESPKQKQWKAKKHYYTWEIVHMLYTHKREKKLVCKLLMFISDDCKWAKKSETILIKYEVRDFNCFLLYWLIRPTSCKIHVFISTLLKIWMQTQNLGLSWCSLQDYFFSNM